MLIKNQNSELSKVIGEETAQKTNKIVSRPDAHYANIHQDFITISEDRLKLYAIDYAKAIENNSFRVFIGMFLTLCIAIYNTDYTTINFFNVFLICSITIVGWTLVKCTVAHFKNDTIKTPEDFVELCKRSADIKEWKGND